MKERSNCCALKSFAPALEQLTEVWRGSYFMENAFSSLISATEAYTSWFQFCALVQKFEKCHMTATSVSIYQSLASLGDIKAT